MTSEHLNAAELAAYRLRTLPPNELLPVSDHLAGCENCQTRLSRISLAASGEVSDVTYEELVAWMDDKLGPIERLELQAKIAPSPSARRELADLLRFKAELNQPAALPTTNIVPVFFGRWILPLAAALALTIGGIWWKMHAPSGAAGFVRLKDHGHDLRITRAGASAAFPNSNDALREALKAAVLDGQLQVPGEISALAGRSGTLAGETQTPSTAFSVLAPITTALRDGKARFRWTPFPGVSAYRIRVMDVATDEIVRTETVPADQPTWSPARPLSAGATYEWEVEALRDEQVLAKAPEPPQPEARFAVISDAKRQELERLDEHAQRSHLVAGVAEAQMGLLDEATLEFTELAKENPESEIPKRLLEKIQQAKKSARRN